MHSVLIGGEEQATLLTKAQEMGLTDGRYVLIPYDTLLYSLPYQNISFYALDNDTKLQEAYDAVLTITLESGNRTFYDAFREAKENGEIARELEATQVNILFLELFRDMVTGHVVQAITTEKGQRREKTDCVCLYFEKNMVKVGCYLHLFGKDISPDCLAIKVSSTAEP